MSTPESTEGNTNDPSKDTSDVEAPQTSSVPKKLIPGVGSTGLEDGPYLPGHPRKKPAPKTADELREIRAKAWKTRRGVGKEGGE